MERMSLRDAAERTARSVTTLRRYIRGGRLRAEKASGRYGPEYVISEEAIAAAGLRTEPTSTSLSRHVEPARIAPLEQALRDSVPIHLYQELQMKHEQLLVQYGMVRVGGLRVLELQGELEVKSRQIAEFQTEIASLKERSSKEAAALRKKLRETELELQGRTLEALALKERMRGLERITRPAGAEGIERHFSEVAEQIRRVERLEPGRSPGSPPTPPWPSTTRDKEPEH